MHKNWFVLLFFLIIQTANASFTKNLWPEWQVNNSLSTATINHEDWQKFLNLQVITNDEGINLINYSKMNKEDIALLDQYIAYLTSININNYNRPEQLAFWLNLYNALTVQLITKYYPINTIEDINISPGLFSVGPWGAKLVTINQVSLSLDEIHNRIIRPIWNDARTHYAINNASIGAPNLNKEAYNGKKIDQQLNEAAKYYINSTRGVQVIEGELVVSKIYDWFKDDFGGVDTHIIEHLKQFAEKPLGLQLSAINTIESYIYNWHLNSIPN